MDGWIFSPGWIFWETKIKTKFLLLKQTETTKVSDWKTQFIKTASVVKMFISFLIARCNNDQNPVWCINGSRTTDRGCSNESHVAPSTSEKLLQHLLLFYLCQVKFFLFRFFVFPGHFLFCCLSHICCRLWQFWQCNSDSNPVYWRWMHGWVSPGLLFLSW